WSRDAAPPPRPARAGDHPFHPPPRHPPPRHPPHACQRPTGALLMPYTLSMALLWVALAVLLGIVVGWLMRSVVAKRQIERARSNHLDHLELERLRARLAELEASASEHDRLRSDPAARRAPLETVPVSPATAPPGDATDEPARDLADLAGAEAVLGTRIERDDLTVIDGIGPKIADLCAGI